MNWISVKERLPEEMQEVLCYYKRLRPAIDCNVGILKRIPENVKIRLKDKNRFHGADEVFFWMPLPEPPKQD